MGAYKYIRKTFEKEYQEGTSNSIYRQKIISWRHGPSIVRVEKPTNIARARGLGYKAKKGIFVVRVRIDKGLRKRRQPHAGRKAMHNYRYVQPDLSHQAIAEQRANRKYPNCEVLNSYWVGEDGQSTFFEVILADRSTKFDPSTEKMVLHRGRAYRGLTSAGKKSRPLAKGRRKQRKA
ncbi:MAG: 50S ribosomal protein L15e [Candidatus Anstonellales archaeon]